MGRALTKNPTYVLRTCAECDGEYVVETRYAYKSKFCTKAHAVRWHSREWQRKTHGWKPRERT